MMARTKRVRGLKSAALAAEGPFPTNPKLRGSAAEGLRFQRAVNAELEALSRFGYVLPNQWFRYSDESGTHWCQTDGLLHVADRVIVVEAKRSLRGLKEGLRQLAKYKAIVELVFQKPAVGVLAFNHWIRDVDLELELIDHPEATLYLDPKRQRHPVGWHFLGA